jgi:hypothetical protein
VSGRKSAAALPEPVETVLMGSTGSLATAFVDSQSGETTQLLPDLV